MEFTEGKKSSTFSSHFLYSLFILFPPSFLPPLTPSTIYSSIIIFYFRPCLSRFFIHLSSSYSSYLTVFSSFSLSLIIFLTVTLLMIFFPFLYLSFFLFHSLFYAVFNHLFFYVIFFTMYFWFMHLIYRYFLAFILFSCSLSLLLLLLLLLYCLCVGTIFIDFYNHFCAYHYFPFVFIVY